MSANSPLQAPPPHGVPDYAIDALFGRGLSPEMWRAELLANGYTWTGGLENRIICKEFWYFKEEIGRLKSEPNTSQGRQPKSNSSKTILMRLKGETGERDERTKNRRLFGSEASDRTLQKYVRQWRQMDSSYGIPKPTGSEVDQSASTMSTVKVVDPSRSSRHGKMANSRRDDRRLAVPSSQPEVARNKTLAYVNLRPSEHHSSDSMTFPFQNGSDHEDATNPATVGLRSGSAVNWAFVNEESVNQHQTHGTFSPSEQPSYSMTGKGQTNAIHSETENQLSSNPRTFKGANGHQSENLNWDTDQEVMILNSVSDFALDPPDKNEDALYSTARTPYEFGIGYEESYLQNSCPNGDSRTSPSHFADTSGEVEEKLFIALTQELSKGQQSAVNTPSDFQPWRDEIGGQHQSGNMHLFTRHEKMSHKNDFNLESSSSPTGDTEMFDASFLGAEEMDDNSASPALSNIQQQNLIASHPSDIVEETPRALRAKRLMTASKVARDAWLKRRVRTLESELQRSKKELEEKDAKILEQARQLEMLQVVGKQASTRDEVIFPLNHTATASNETSSSDKADIEYLETLNSRILQETQNRRHEEATKKLIWSRHSHCVAEIDSPRRKVQSKDVIPLAMPLRVAATSNNNMTRSVKETSTRSGVGPSSRHAGIELQPKTSKGGHSPLCRLGRKLSNTFLGMHRDNDDKSNRVPPIPLLPSKDFPLDLAKRLTVDSGYASFEMARFQGL